MKDLENWAKSNFAVRNLTKTKVLTGQSWQQAKDLVVGKKYELSLAIVGNQRSRALNLKYRCKDKPANVLSFSLSQTSGEVFLNPHSRENLLSLFIHGLLHLKGLGHGSKMESEEKKLGQIFGCNEKRDYRRSRYRDRIYPSSRLRNQSRR